MKYNITIKNKARFILLLWKVVYDLLLDEKQSLSNMLSVYPF